MKKIREEDLIRYLYKECTPELTAAIEQAVVEQMDVKERLEVLRRSIRQLDQLKLKSPSRLSIKTILKYASGLHKK